MNTQIQYEIQFLNGNKITGRINCKLGQEIKKIKKKIMDFESLKNEESFTLINNEISTPKVTAQFTHLKLREQYSTGVTSVISVKSRKMSQQSMFEETSMIIAENKYEDFIEDQPEIPPKVCGYVSFPNSFFFCFSSRKYLTLNTQYLSFYNNQQSLHPYKQVIPQEIQQIKSYKRKQFYCIRLILREEQINMKFINKDICKEWVGYLNQVLNFSHYLREKQAFSKKETFQKYVQTFLKPKGNLDSTNIVKLQDEQDTIVMSAHSSIPCQNSIKKTFNHILKLSAFEITHKIDSGSFSTIYLSKKNNRQLALKQMNKQKLLYKGQMKYALTQLNVLIKCRACPYIVPIFYAFQTHQYIYLALKYISTGNLGRLMQKRKKLQQNEAINLIAQLICAIQYLHDRKILYRDLKPENILLDKDGHLYLTDFGLAKQLEEEQEEAHSFLGTPLYLAPQRFSTTGNGIDFRSDIYAVGIIFFEMLHGYHPFSADNFNSVIYNIRNTDIQIDQTLSVLTKKFLLQTLEKTPSKRLSRMSKHPLFFKKLNWKQIQNRQHPGIKLIQTQPKSLVQITYEVDVDYNETNYPDKKIVGWNYNFQESN